MPTRKTKRIVPLLVVILCLGAILVLQVKRMIHTSNRPTRFGDFVHEHSKDGANTGHPYGNGPMSKDEVASILEDYDKKIAEEPENGELVSEKIHFAIDHAPAVAASTCERLLQYSPESEFLMSHLVTAHMRCGNNAKALRWARKCVEKRANVDNLLLLGRVYYEMRALDEARGVYRRVLKIDPENVHASAGLRYIDILSERRQGDARRSS